jgi:copper chaperone NosL
MSKIKVRTLVTCIAAFGAAVLFVASLKVPVWQLKMEAPQYQDNEALRVHVFAGSMSGDLREIKVLNRYIGVRIPEHLPQWSWLPASLLAAGGLGLAALVLPGKARSRSLIGIVALLGVVMAFSAGLAQWQMHQIGHDRDPHAPLKDVHNFTAPLLGRVKVANFVITTSLDRGAWMIGAGMLLQVGGAMTALKLRRPCLPGCHSFPPGSSLKPSL